MADRINQDVTDISSVGELLRYALAGQLEQVTRQRFDLSAAKVAQAAGLGGNARNAAPVLSRALREGPTAEQLRKLDEAIASLALDMHGTGGLSSLALRLAGDGRSKIGDSAAAFVPPVWRDRILVEEPASEIEVLVQASALLSGFSAAHRAGARSIETFRERYSADIQLLTRRLILISAAPPTSLSFEAQHLLGTLASYAFQTMRDELEAAVRSSPLAFRVWPAITHLVKRVSEPEDEHELRAWVRRLIRDSRELRKFSLSAGSSLDLELAMSVPAAWSPPQDDWIDEALFGRARDNSATLRERSTAAMGLWQRAIQEDRNLNKTEESLRQLIAEFRSPESRPDAAAGFRWVAATLEHVIDKRVPVCNDWPDVDEPWFRHVQQAAAELDSSEIPEHLRVGTKNLFRNMILQNAGEYRRWAIDTVVTSGWSRPITQALGRLLDKETDEAWLRIRAESALGSLQARNRWIEADLTTACLGAYKNLMLDELTDDEPPPRSRVTELHAALFAVGDLFGAEDAEEYARVGRERLRLISTELANMKGARALVLRRPTRAAAYLLAFTAQPNEGEEDLSEELLKRLVNHPDKTTARLSRWALSFRFSPDGGVRPLLAAAVHGEPYDVPW